jgi:hypothetical protein
MFICVCVEKESAWTQFKKVLNAPANFYSKFSLNR